MKRLPLFATFLLFILLCASIAYWGMQLFKPPLRPVAAPPRTAQAEIRPEAAGGLFGGKAGAVAVASNYQLKGVVFSGDPLDSVAILSTDGKPAQAIRLGKEVTPDVMVKEVHRDYVLLQDKGAAKRVDLPESAKGQVNFANIAPVPVQPTFVPPPVPQFPQGGAPQPPQAAPVAPIVPKSAPPSSVVVTPPPVAPMPPPATPAVSAPPSAPVVQQPYVAPAAPPPPRSVAEGAPLQSR